MKIFYFKIGSEDAEAPEIILKNNIKIYGDDRIRAEIVKIFREYNDIFQNSGDIIDLSKEN